MRRVLRIGLPVACAFLAGSLARAWAHRWNATDEEVRRPLAGDTLVAGAQMQSTRAITINAPVDRVFPWLAQLGQDRGGFYSYDWLENRMGLGIHSTDRILTAFQHLEVGDAIAVAPGPPFYGFRVADVAPPTHLVLEMRIHPFTGLEQGPEVEGPKFHGSWAFALESVGDNATRLIGRTRSRLDLPTGLRQAYLLLLDTIQFVMERRMLIGVRDRAERIATTP